MANLIFLETMKFIKPEDLKPARPAKGGDIPRILREAEEISVFLENGGFEGLHKEGLAIASNQVIAEEPLSYFVLRKKLPGMGSHVIINPRIKEKNLDLLVKSKEACLSWPYRKERNVERCAGIGVEYFIIKRHPVFFWKKRLKRVAKKMGGLPAIVFQHEWQHLVEGKTIYG